MNMSIRKQLTIIFIGLMAAMMLLNFLINTFFLEDFYYVRKEQVLVEAYRLLNDDIDEMGRYDDEAMQELNDLSNENGITYLVTDMNYNELLWTESTYFDIMKGRLNGYGIGLDNDDVEVLESNDNYTIQKKYDSEIGLNYLEMWGTLDKGFYFIMRINIEGIHDSVRISNEFLLYICLFGFALTALIVWFTTRQVTRPLNELTELSKRMADLDFNAKYTSGGTNEIGQLGAHFNEMSEALEKAYGQLMTANNELQKDIEQKEQIDDMRKEFLSNVSHELKTPIALMQGYAEGLKECINDDPESREFYCEVIMDEAAKMNGMVQKLLTLNELESGNNQIVMERFDLAQLIQNKVQSVVILAQQKNAEIKYHGSDSLFAWGDEYQVEEVVTNYLSNAVNYVNEGGEVDVSLEVLPPQMRDGYEVNEVRVTVFNTGSQIPQEDIDQVWDKFYKVDKARTREYGGSGIGLSIVKAIMDSFRQNYGVENREDGVAFWFELQCGDYPYGSEDQQNGQSADTKKKTDREKNTVRDGEWRPDT